MQLTKIGKYELLERLGRGTSADVYRAKDTLMGRQVALKVVEPETADLAPFSNEARLLARLQHPNIVTIHSSDLIDGKVVVDMELVEGKTLRQLLKDEKQLPLDRALKVIAQILNALAYAHGMGVIHRDMKPANILIGPEDAVKVVDFGIADVLASQGYLAGAGTFSHMAPECFEDKSDRRSDIYSVGVILYEMLVGELPIQAERNTLTTWKEALDRQERPKPLSAFLPNVPKGLQGIVSLALTHDKQRRFQTAEAFLDARKRNSFYALPNSEAELRLIDRFEAAYNRIDRHLRQELNADRKTGFADVVRQYAQQHPEWQSERDLLRLGRVRNELRHEMIDSNQWRPVPVTADIERLGDIGKDLGVSETKQEQAKDRLPVVDEEVPRQSKRPPLPMPLGDAIQHKAPDPSDTKEAKDALVSEGSVLAAEIKLVHDTLKAEIKLVQNTIKEAREHRTQVTSDVQEISDQGRSEQRPSATNLQASPTQVNRTPHKEQKKRQGLDYFSANSILDAVEWESIKFVYDDEGYV